MKIYIAHSKDIPYQTELYQPIRDNKSLEVDEIILPHETNAHRSNTREFYQTIDCFIAECTMPSTGLGIELGWAYDNHKRIYAIHKSGSEISSSIKSVTSKIYSYSSKEEMIQLIQKIIREVKEDKTMKVVGTMFFKDQKLLIDKPRKRSTYQMIGGRVEEGETPKEAAIRECHEELGPKATFQEEQINPVMEFDEVATSDGVTPIHFYVFEYLGNLEGELSTSDEIEKFLWYETTYGTDILSNTLKQEVVPYCLQKRKIR